MDMNKLALKPLEAADAISVSRARMYELIAQGVIPSIRVGGSIRVPVEGLRKWIADQVKQTGDAA